MVSFCTVFICMFKACSDRLIASSAEVRDRSPLTYSKEKSMSVYIQHGNLCNTMCGSPATIYAMTS